MYSRRLTEAIIDTDHFLLFRLEWIARHVNSFLPQKETKRSSIMIPKASSETAIVYTNVGLYNVMDDGQSGILSAHG